MEIELSEQLKMMNNVSRVKVLYLLIESCHINEFY